MSIGLSANSKTKTNKIDKFGANFDIDTGTTPETVWAHGGVFPFIDAGIQMDVISSDANDIDGGTGAQKIFVTYYTTDNTEKTKEVTLNGTTAVELDDDVKFVSRAYVSQSGSNNTNAGEINIVDRATGLVVYQSIEIAEGQTLSAVQICPKNKEGRVKTHSVTFAKTQAPAGSADMRFNLRKSNGTILTKHVTVISSTKSGDNVIYGSEENDGILMESGDIAFWQCIGVSANDTPIEGRFKVEFKSVE